MAHDDELPLWSTSGPAYESAVRPPGDYIREELEKREWGQLDLAKITNRPLPTINEIIQGKRGIMPEMAVLLGMAFGTSAMVWMERESRYRLSQVEQQDPETQQRARLFALAPVKDMEKRGWIRHASSAVELEKQLIRFYGVESFDEDHLQIVGAARQSQIADEFTSVQRAWLYRAKQLALLLNVKEFSQAKFLAGMGEIKTLAEKAEKVRFLPQLLAELGVRLVIVEPLPKSRIDGAVFWLDGTAPVIVLSLRYDRIDWFWHTLAHELQHVRFEDRQSVDSNLVGESRVAPLNEMEERADREGAAFLIPDERLESFIVRVKPFYSKERIHLFAKRMQVHPGIVNGQLQHRGELKWSANRETLVKIRDLVVATTITDGWGKPNIKL